MAKSKVVVAVRLRSTSGTKQPRPFRVSDNGESHELLVDRQKDTGGPYQYKYWKVLEDNCQEDVYEICAKPVVESVLGGYNGTILAYGQTGSGKTYTIFGSELPTAANVEHHGVIPRTIHQVFSQLPSHFGCGCSIKLTFIEIFNETVRDLLNPTVGSVAILENERGETYLKNVRPVSVSTEQEALDCFMQGQQSRITAGHSLNQKSSRSHAVFTLQISSINSDGTDVTRKLNIVDLAGSERTKKAKISGSLTKQAHYINKSLSSLSLVVKELRRKAAHISYRNSKLTHLLKDSLGGNSKTLMIACLLNDQRHLQESLSTCRFADDMQQIETTVRTPNYSLRDSICEHQFQLDPAMMKFISNMTEKRVAKEMVSVRKELEKTMASVLDPSAKSARTVSENPARQELQRLREKARIADMKREKALTASKLAELKFLRARVKQLESEKLQGFTEQKEVGNSNTLMIKKEVGSRKGLACFDSSNMRSDSCTSSSPSPVLSQATCRGVLYAPTSGRVPCKIKAGLTCAATQKDEQIPSGRMLLKRHNAFLKRSDYSGKESPMIGAQLSAGPMRMVPDRVEKEIHQARHQHNDTLDTLDTFRKSMKDAFLLSPPMLKPHRYANRHTSHRGWDSIEFDKTYTTFKRWIATKMVKVVPWQGKWGAPCGKDEGGDGALGFVVLSAIPHEQVCEILQTDQLDAVSQGESLFHDSNVNGEGQECDLTESHPRSLPIVGPEAVRNCCLHPLRVPPLELGSFDVQ